MIAPVSRLRTAPGRDLTFRGLVLVEGLPEFGVHSSSQVIVTEKEEGEHRTVFQDEKGDRGELVRYLKGKMTTPTSTP